MTERRNKTKALRSARITDAAKKLFIAQGYDPVTMDMVAAEASMSKVTIYKYFPTKQDLLFNVTSDWMKAANETIWPQDMDETLPFEVFLDRLMQNFCKVFLTMNAISARRMMLGALPKIPELGRIVFEGGPSVILQKLDAYFQRMTKAGHAHIDQPDLAAAQFYNLMQSDIELRGVYLGEMSSPQKIQSHIASSVNMFASYYR